MNLTPEQYERLCRFIDGDMSLEEMDALEQEMEAVPAMRQQLDFEMEVRSQLLFTSQPQAVPALEKKPDGGKPLAPVWQISRGALGIAATVLAAIAGVYLLLSQNPAPSVAFNNNKQPDNAAPRVVENTGKPGQDSVPAIAKTATFVDLKKLVSENLTRDSIPAVYTMEMAGPLLAYNEGNDEPLLQIDWQNPPTMRTATGQDKMQLQVQIRYYQGIALLNKGKSTAAIAAMLWVKKHAEEATYRNKASWYLALGYLQNGQGSEAVPLLQQLSGTANRYKTKAATLLQKLQ